MKMLKFALLASLLGFVLSSCTFYEDGPLISILSKKERVANTWVADEVIEADGDVVTDGYDNWTWTFTEGGEATVSYPVLGSTINFQGEWNLVDNGAIFQLIIDYGLGTDIADYEILRLAEDQFWLLAEDGTEFRLETK
jgi:hypothetical protein